MRIPIIVGVFLFVLVVAAAWLVPQFLSADQRAAEEAMVEATLAQRLLHRYDHGLPSLAERVQPEALKSADLEAVAEQVQENLEQFRREATQTASRLRSQAEADGLPAPEIQVPGAHAAGLQRALRGFDELLRQNAELLKKAREHARAASGAGHPVGVAQVSGMVEYTRATALLAEAQYLRRRQANLLERLLTLATESGALRGREALPANLDVSPAVSQLRKDLDELRERRAATAERRDRLATEIAERESELQEITTRLEQARDEKFALEKEGFIAGDDASFEAYRQRYQEITARLKSLQEREELLRFGGRTDVQFTDEDVLTAEITGGETVVGLETLKEQVSAAEDQIRRLDAGLETLEAHIAYLEQAGESATDRAGRHATQREQIESEIAALEPQILELAQAAAKKEAEALKAAQAAVRAYRNSQQAAEQWVSQAREIQSDKDPERANPRLRMILSEPAVPLMGLSAEVEARMLVGRIHLQTIESNRQLLDGMGLLEELRGAAPEGFVPAEFQEQIAAATEQGFKELEDAEKACEKLLQKTPKETKWIPQAMLAGIYHLLARLDPGQAPLYLANALEQVEAATAGSEQFPYRPEQVRFREHLRKRVGAGTPAEPGGETEDTGAGTEPPPADGED